MSNPFRVGMAWAGLAALALTGCAREAPPAAATTLAVTPDAGAAAAPAPVAAEAARVAWAGEALRRNPNLEIVATDASKGLFTVRMIASGDLRTLSIDELIAAPPPTVEEIVFAKEAASALANAPESPTPSDYTITRESGRVNITGPGVEIASASAAPVGSVAAAGASASSAPSAPVAGNAELRSEPMICQGGRMLRIDNRVIEFAGDGLVVEDGCQLYLTNSRITAGGTAITATRGQVHITNSTVSGRTGAIDASLGAEVFMSDAQIQGQQRRFDTAQIKDLGGNRYR